MSSLQEFRDYVTNSGVNFDILTIEQKREWRETFDRSRQPAVQPGELMAAVQQISQDMSKVSQNMQILRKDQSKDFLRQLNPWQKMSQTSAGRVKDLRSKYAKRVPPCCVISGHNQERDLTLAHILPHSTDANIQHKVGMSNKLNNFRNVMWLCSALESAFDRQQLSLEPVDPLSRTRFKVRIWEPEILTIPLYDGAARTISSIVDAVIDFSLFSDKIIPYRRCLSYHTLMCYLTHLDRFGGQHELPEAFDDISQELAGDGVKHLRNEYFEGHLTQYHFEMLEETESLDNASGREKAKKDRNLRTTVKKRRKYTITGLRKRMKKMQSN
mmetsp:Transcript_13434/g.18196  ORF Transcript_13434/g.18196 Transcript_13434/m.18196 type:complete len:328 (-) Transcript_13434:106-1089(-)